MKAFSLRPASIKSLSDTMDAQHWSAAAMAAGTRATTAAMAQAASSGATIGHGTSLAEADTAALQRVLEFEAHTLDGPTPEMAIVDRSRPVCGPASAGGCLSTAVLDGLKQPDFAAALAARNAHSEELPLLAGATRITPSTFAAPLQTRPAVRQRRLWCTLPGYVLGQSLVVCAETWADVGRQQVEEHVVLLRGNEADAWFVR